MNFSGFREIPDDVLTAPLSVHIQAATPDDEGKSSEQRVLPVSMLLASGRFSSVVEAEAALDRDPVVRRVLETAIA